MHRVTLSYAVGVLLLGSTAPAYAYIDPGTGTLIVQAVIGGVSAVLTVAGVYIARIRSVFSRNRGQASEQSEAEPRQ